MAYESTMSPILATAAIATVLAAMAFLVLIEVPAVRSARTFAYDHTQKLMALVAAIAMASSLYYSEAVGFLPCEFCWFQRIAMYPIAVLLAVAVVTRSRLQPRFVVALAGTGLLLSLYHYQLQLFPDQVRTCSGPVSCAGRYVNEYGFVTIPFMAGCAFLTILLLQVGEWRAEKLLRRWDELSEGE